MNTLDELRLVLFQAQLPPRDVYELVLVMTYMIEIERKNLLALLQEKPEWAKKLKQALTQKKKALATGNQEVWKKYINAEEQALVEVGRH